VIRLVEAFTQAADAAESGFAAATRRALGADAACVIELLPRGQQPILDADGLAPSELELVEAARGAAAAGAGERSVVVHGFRSAVYVEASVAGVGAAAICALQRHGDGFDNPELAATFARHAAVASGIRRHARRLDRSRAGDPVDVLGICELEEGGYDSFNRALARELDAAVRSTRFAVLLWEPELELLRPLPGAFGADPDELAPPHAAHDWCSSAARVFATGEPYLTNHAPGDDGVLQDHVDAYGIERMMTVPLTVGSECVGVLQVVNKRGAFTVADLQRTVRLGPRVAVGARVARMRDTLLRRQRLSEILGDAAIGIASGRDLQEFLGSTLDSISAELHASMIVLAPTAGAPLIRRRGPDRGHLEELVLRQAREASSLRIYGLGARRAGRPGWSAAHVPVLMAGEQVATLSALRVGGDPFERDECGALSRLAHLVALAWATESYQRQLADSATAAERQRIADELHDQVAQLLFAARLSLDFALEIPGLPEGAAANVGRGRDLLLRADDATRQVMERNAQASEDRLSDRLAALVASVEEEFARPVALEIAPAVRDVADAMSGASKKLIARAAREALVNAAKHAGPCQLAVRVTVTRRSRLLLTVTDGGIGVGDKRADGYGTAALRRAVRRHGGVLRVNPIDTGGTKVAVSLPL
jgi:signal transduction histidine kinase